MAEQGIVQQYKTIEYRYFDNGHRDLVLLLPWLGYSPLEPFILIEALAPVANVLFIQSGYLGITKVEANQAISDFRLAAFASQLNDLIGQFTFDKLIVIGSSMGSLAAVSFVNHYPRSIGLLIVTDPAYYRGSWWHHSLYRSLLALLLLNPDIGFRLVTSILDLFPSLRDVLTAMRAAAHNIGARSFLLGLQEGLRFNGANQSVITAILTRGTTMIVGKRDAAFQLLGVDYFRRLPNVTFQSVDAGHSVWIDAAEQVVGDVTQYLSSG